MGLATVWAGAGAHQLVGATLGSRPCATKALVRGPETAVWATLWPESGSGQPSPKPVHCVVPEFSKPRQAAQWTRPCLQFLCSWPLFRNFTSRSPPFSFARALCPGCCSLGATTKQKSAKPKQSVGNLAQDTRGPFRLGTFQNLSGSDWELV